MQPLAIFNYPPSEQRSCDIGFTPSVRPSVSPSVRPACHVRSILSTLLDGFLPYWTQIITSMRGCATHNDLWPWPIFSRSFRHDFAMKLLKYGTYCGVHSTACTLLDGIFPYWAQMITSIRGCATYNDLWPWPRSSKSFSHDCNKTAKIWHILSCPLYSMYSSGWILSVFGTDDH